jgi:hypothetical protein
VHVPYILFRVRAWFLGSKGSVQNVWDSQINRRVALAARGFDVAKEVALMGAGFRPAGSRIDVPSLQLEDWPELEVVSYLI